MKTLLGMIAGLCGMVLLGSIMALPYFRPEKPWPDWLFALVAFLFVVLCIAVWPNRRTPQQIIRDYEELVRKEKEQTLLVEQARHEKWRGDCILRLEQELAAMRGRISFLRNVTK